jgi:hypothetical protein
VVLEKDGGIVLTDCVKSEEILEEGGKECPAYNKQRKANWICHILRRNCLLKQDNEGKIKGRIDVTGRQ